ncbi:sensor histidine kinase [Haloferax profundi]|uniref:histidine kinase n=1 Tax=Haloferax profundi TaxID=1544718 RepID=A0A0W1R2R8_9EURY|nr:PAS domain-containing sensor histidine kinase [Haloferax profundi]KTG07511.1 hypothetical protein AUR66_05185 [Haloferax profundi]
MDGPTTGTTTILYVTGTESHTEQVRDELERQPMFEVVSVRGSAETRDHLSERSDIQCLVCANDLPSTTGVGLISSLRRDYPELPMVLYPKDGTEETAAKAISADATEYISYDESPDHVDELVSTIRKAINDSWPTIALRERLKELQAIQQVTNILTDASTRPLTEMLQEVVDHVPGSFQYPESAEARLTVGDTTVTSEQFVETDQMLTVWTDTAADEKITLTVVYTDPKPSADQGPFLSEENQLCETLVKLLQSTVERRTYLDDLSESEQLFRQVTENIKEVVWVTDLSKENLLYVNPAYERVWGRSVDSLYADPSSFFEAVHPEDKADLERAIAEQDRGHYDEEYRIRQPSGAVRWVHDRAVPVFDKDDSLYRIVGLAEDITNRKNREQQLALLNRVLRHNLRNDLNVVMGYAELVSRSADVDDEIARYAETIFSVSDHLMALAEKQRTVASELTELPIPEPVDVPGILENVQKTLQNRYPEATVDVTTPDVGSLTLPPQIEEAILELGMNALEHTDAETPAVAIDADVSDGELVVQVTDNGPLIPRMEIEILGKREDALIHGSGIGLWLVHGIVTFAGGTLSFDSNEPRGNVVTIRL